jgi:hypothetical protein
MQSSLPKDLVPLGASTLLMIISTSCSIFLAVGQTVFSNALSSILLSSPAVPPYLLDQILSVGAINIDTAISPQYLPTVIDAYERAVSQIFVCTNHFFPNFYTSLARILIDLP